MADSPWIQMAAAKPRGRGYSQGTAGVYMRRCLKIRIDGNDRLKAD